MLKIIKKYLTPEPSGETVDTVTQTRRIHIASCVLLLEIAHADDNFSISEKTTIREILAKQVNIPEQDIDEIMALAVRDREQSVGLYEYTSFINRVFSRNEKRTLIESIWKVIYADGVVDQYEDYLVHKLAELLRLDHSDLIAAKIKTRGTEPSLVS
ncbi:MAG: TerB family tellurite resistance protein [bacterium]|nr:TerB family tellurite resistance protein [bacterium]